MNLGAIGAAVTGGLQLGQQFLNYQQQQENLEYQKSLQQQLFAREDSSIQRRVADLKAGGLSPVLAAGQGAGTGGVVSTAAPQLGDMSNLATDAMAMMSQEANIARTQSEMSLMRMQEKKLESERLAINTRRRMDQHDLNLAQDSGVRTHPGAIGGNFSDLLGALKNSLLSPVVEKQQKKVDAVREAKKFSGAVPNAGRSAAGQKLWYEE